MRSVANRRLSLGSEGGRSPVGTKPTSVMAVNACVVCLTSPTVAARRVATVRRRT